MSARQGELVKEKRERRNKLCWIGKLSLLLVIAAAIYYLWRRSCVSETEKTPPRRKRRVRRLHRDYPPLTSEPEEAHPLNGTSRMEAVLYGSTMIKGLVGSPFGVFDPLAKLALNELANVIKDAAGTTGIPFAKDIVGWALGEAMGKLFPPGPSPFEALNEKLREIQASIQNVQRAVDALLNFVQIRAIYQDYIDVRNQSDRAANEIETFWRRYREFLPRPLLTVGGKPVSEEECARSGKACVWVQGSALEPRKVVDCKEAHPEVPVLDCVRREIVEWKRSVLNGQTGIEAQLAVFYNERSGTFLPRRGDDKSPGLFLAWRFVVESQVTQPKPAEAKTPVVSYRKVFIDQTLPDKIDETVFMPKGAADMLWGQWLPWFRLQVNAVGMLLEAYHTPDTPGGGILLDRGRETAARYQARIEETKLFLPRMPAFVDTLDYCVQHSANLVWGIWPVGKGPSTELDVIPASSWRIPTTREVTFFVTQMGGMLPVDSFLETPFPKQQLPTKGGSPYSWIIQEGIGRWAINWNAYNRYYFKKSEYLTPGEKNLKPATAEEIWQHQQYGITHKPEEKWGGMLYPDHPAFWEVENVNGLWRNTAGFEVLDRVPYLSFEVQYVGRGAGDQRGIYRSDINWFAFESFPPPPPGGAAPKHTVMVREYLPSAEVPTPTLPPGLSNGQVVGDTVHTYVIQDGRKHWVPNPSSVTALKLPWPPRNVDPSLLQRVATGAPAYARSARTDEPA